MLQEHTIRRIYVQKITDYLIFDEISCNGMH